MTTLTHFECELALRCLGRVRLFKCNTINNANWNAHAPHQCSRKMGVILTVSLARFKTVSSIVLFWRRDIAHVVHNPCEDTLNSIKAPSEQFQLTDHALYLYAPDGIGSSKFAARVERCLGVAATGRNWNTVSKLIELAGD